MENSPGDPRTLHYLILDNISGLMEQYPDRSLNAAAAARHDMDNILNITWPQHGHTTQRPSPRAPGPLPAQQQRSRPSPRTQLRPPDSFILDTAERRLSCTRCGYHVGVAATSTWNTSIGGYLSGEVDRIDHVDGR